MGRSVPWISWIEWLEVKAWLLSSNEPDMQRGFFRVNAWRSRGRVPLAVDVTAGLVELALAERTLLRGSPTLSPYVLRVTYSLLIVRLVNGVADSMQRGRVATSVARLATGASLPPALTELRHAATHGELPPLAGLRAAASQAMTWLKSYYWEAQSEQLAASHARIADLLTQIVSGHAAQINKSQVAQCSDDDEMHEPPQAPSTAAPTDWRAPLSALRDLIPPAWGHELLDPLLSSPALAPPLPTNGSTASLAWERTLKALFRHYPSLRTMILGAALQKLTSLSLADADSSGISEPASLRKEKLENVSPAMAAVAAAAASSDDYNDVRGPADAYRRWIEHLLPPLEQPKATPSRPAKRRKLSTPKSNQGHASGSGSEAAQGTAEATFGPLDNGVLDHLLSTALKALPSPTLLPIARQQVLQLIASLAARLEAVDGTQSCQPGITADANTSVASSLGKGPCSTDPGVEVTAGAVSIRKGPSGSSIVCGEVKGNASSSGTAGVSGLGSSGAGSRSAGVRGPKGSCNPSGASTAGVMGASSSGSPDGSGTAGSMSPSGKGSPFGNGTFGVRGITNCGTGSGTAGADGPSGSGHPSGSGTVGISALSNSDNGSGSSAKGRDGARQTLIRLAKLALQSAELQVEKPLELKESVEKAGSATVRDDQALKRAQETLKELMAKAAALKNQKKTQQDATELDQRDIATTRSRDPQASSIQRQEATRVKDEVKSMQVIRKASQWVPCAIGCLPDPLNPSGRLPPLMCVALASP